LGLTFFATTGAVSSCEGEGTWARARFGGAVLVVSTVVGGAIASSTALVPVISSLVENFWACAI